MLRDRGQGEVWLSFIGGNDMLNKGQRVAVATAICVAASFGLSGAARAYEVTAGEFTVHLDTTLTTGVQFRTQGRDCRLVGTTNGGCGGQGPLTDDGNLNYDKWDMTSATSSILEEIEITNGQYGFFGRINAFYDPLQNDASHTERTDLSDDARRVVGRGVDLLDAYVYGLFSIDGHPVDVRLGNQAFNWGESLFTPGGINESNPLIVSRLRQPGSEIKEATQPMPAVRASAGLTDDLSVEAYYQFLWDNTELDPVGTFFSTNDIVGPGAQGIFLNVDPGQAGSAAYAPSIPPNYIPKAESLDARNSGQYGVALRYFEENTSILFGLYYLRYHFKTPIIGASADYVHVGGPIFIGVPTSYFEEFPEDVDLYGFSFNAPLGDLALGFETSYQPDFPTALGLGDVLQGAANKSTATAGHATMSGYVNEERWQTHLTGFYAIAPSTPLLGTLLTSTGGSKGTLLGEIAATVFPSLDASIPYSAPQFSSGVDKTSWGYRLSLQTEYDRVLGTNVTLSPTISWQHDVSGNAPGGRSAPFVDGRKAISLGLDASYLSYTANLAYTNYFGAGANNTNTDRDFISFSLGYSF